MPEPPVEFFDHPSNSSVTCRPTAARSHDSGRRSTWWVPQKRSIPTVSRTFLQRGHRPDGAAAWAADGDLSAPAVVARRGRELKHQMRPGGQYVRRK
jgi:hypothetical protein